MSEASEKLTNGRPRSDPHVDLWICSLVENAPQVPEASDKIQKSECSSGWSEA